MKTIHHQSIPPSLRPPPLYLYGYNSICTRTSFSVHRWHYLRSHLSLFSLSLSLSLSLQNTWDINVFICAKVSVKLADNNNNNNNNNKCLSICQCMILVKNNNNNNNNNNKCLSICQCMILVKNVTKMWLKRDFSVPKGLDQQKENKNTSPCKILLLSICIYRCKRQV